MNADEKEIYQFLDNYGETFVSVNEISKRLGIRRRYEMDRIWARPILRRMEMDRLVESNPFGEYRIFRRENEPDHFKKAMETGNAPLGDTTIITLNDLGDST